MVCVGCYSGRSYFVLKAPTLVLTTLTFAASHYFWPTVAKIAWKFNDLSDFHSGKREELDFVNFLKIKKEPITVPFIILQSE